MYLFIYLFLNFFSLFTFFPPDTQICLFPKDISTPWKKFPLTDVGNDSILRSQGFIYFCYIAAGVFAQGIKMHLRVTQRAGLHSVGWLACSAHLLCGAYSSVNAARWCNKTRALTVHY